MYYKRLSDDMLTEAFVLYTAYLNCCLAINRIDRRAQECASSHQPGKCAMCKPWFAQAKKMKRFLRSERQAIINWIRLVRSFEIIPNFVTVATPGALNFLVSFMKDARLRDPRVGHTNLVGTNRSYASWIDEQWDSIQRAEATEPKL